MAVSINEICFPEVPVNADYMLFAEDLVNYVISLNVPFQTLERENIQFRYHVHNAFDQFVQEAVRFIDNWLNINFDAVTLRQIHPDHVVLSSYRIFADAWASESFYVRFSSQNFLLFSVRISKMAALYYGLRCMDAPTLAKSYIINILEKYRMEMDGWNNLKSYAMEFVRISPENKSLLLQNVPVMNKKCSKRKLEPSSDEEPDSKYQSMSSS